MNNAPTLALLRQRGALGLLLYLLGCCAPTLAAEITLTIEPDPPRADESFQALFATRDDVDQEPDFSALENDFRIVERSRQTSLEWVNGRSDRTTSWALTLLPLKSGPVTIPAIPFGSDRSPARTIDPIGAGAGLDPAVDQDLLLEVSAEPASPYVQQEVLLTVRFMHRAGLGVHNATLSDPELDADAVIKRLGKDQPGQINRGGRRFEVIERRYVIYPQVSGPLNIAPLELTAKVNTRGRQPSFNIFRNFSATRRVVASPVTLEVQPVPASFSGDHWLPARRLRFYDEWQPETRAVEVSEPLTRTLFLWADGLTASQLPTVELVPPGKVRLYPDQAQQTDQESDTGITGLRQQQFAIIPGDQGRLDFPALEVHWWNTVSDREEVARIDPAVVAVRPVPGAPVQPAPTVDPAMAPLPERPAVVPVDDTAASAAEPWMVASILLGCGWLFTLVLWQRSRQRPPTVPESGPTGNAGPAPQSLRQACGRNDPAAAKAALLEWARRHLDRPVPSLNALCHFTAPEMTEAVRELNAALYAPGAGRDGWRGERLWREVNGHPWANAVDSGRSDGGLPRLFLLAR